MPKQKPDISFEREGRSLRRWLQELVAEDSATRRAAGEALQAMMYGVPSVHTDLAEIEWDSLGAISEQGDRFNNAVRSVLKSPEFVTKGFVRKLILYRMALKDDWRRRMDKAHQQDDTSNTYQDLLFKRFEAADGNLERTEAARRYMRWVCASMARNLKESQNAYAGAESLAAPGAMAAIVFDSLDTALLADRPGLHVMLADKDTRHYAARALARIGPPAVDFAAVFFEELDARPSQFFDGSRTLGSIGRDDPDVIDGLLKRLRSGSSEIRAGAAAALFHAGPPLAGRLEVALDLLIGATLEAGLVCAAVPALASLGRDNEVAFLQVLELAKPRPPRWRTDENFPDYRYDEVLAERGAAINSLPHFRQFAERVVPVLVDALDTFEEYDPDWQYQGEYERVCVALEPFGPLAAPAVPRLVQFLEEWPTQPEHNREWPQAVFRVLAAIGAPAAEALPSLEQLRRTQKGDESTFNEFNADDPLDRAIMIIRGGTETP